MDEDEADVIVGTTVDESLEDRIKVTVVAMDNKDDDLQGWLYEAITAALVTTEGERITSFEIGQPFEK